MNINRLNGKIHDIEVVQMEYRGDTDKIQLELNDSDHISTHGSATSMEHVPLNSSAVSLRMWTWKNMLLKIIVPTIIVAVCITAVSSGLAPYIASLMSDGTKAMVDDSLESHVVSAATKLRGYLDPIERSALIFCDLTREALNTPRIPPPFEMNAYGLDPVCDNNAISTLYDYGGSDVYLVPPIPCIDENGQKADQSICNITYSQYTVERYVWRTGALDPFMMSTCNHLGITQSYVNFHCRLLRMYPTRMELTGVRIAELFGCFSDTTNYEFQYGADLQHNPARSFVWTGAYVDPGFAGWVTSCIAPVYFEWKEGDPENITDVVEAVPGFDVGLSIMMENLANIPVPWNGYLIVLDRDGVILSLPSAAFSDWGVTEMTNFSYQNFVVDPTFKTDDFNIFVREDTHTLASALSKSPNNGTVKFQLAGSTKLAKWIRDVNTGWTCVVMANASAALEEYNKQMMIGKAYTGFTVGAGVLMCLSVFIVVIISVRGISRKLSNDIGLVGRNIVDISESKYVVKYKPNEIVELDKTMRFVSNLANKLRTITLASEKFVPVWLLSILGASDVSNVKPGMVVSKEMAVMFIDIRGYTTMSSGAKKETTINFLNAYAHIVSPVITSCMGTIDKYYGDGIMALFGDPAKAVKCAIFIRHTLADFVFDFENGAGKIKINTGCGIAYGTLDVGVIGDEKRMDITVIGEIPNIASRLECLTAQTGAQILVTKNVIMKAREQHEIELNARFIGYVLLKGLKDPMDVYEVLVSTDPAISIKLETKAIELMAINEYSGECEQMTLIMNLYQARKFRECLIVIKNAASSNRDKVFSLIKKSMKPERLRTPRCTSTNSEKDGMAITADYNHDFSNFTTIIVSNVSQPGVKLVRYMCNIPDISEITKEDIVKAAKIVDEYYSRFDDLLKICLSSITNSRINIPGLVTVIDDLKHMNNVQFFDGFHRIYAQFCCHFSKSPDEIPKTSVLPISFETK
jgi:class 3 adenylate cyclase